MTTEFEVRVASWTDSFSFSWDGLTYLVEKSKVEDQSCGTGLYDQLACTSMSSFPF